VWLRGSTCALLLWTLAYSRSWPPPTVYRPGCFLSWPCTLPQGPNVRRRSVHLRADARSSDPGRPSEVPRPFSARNPENSLPETASWEWSATSLTRVHRIRDPRAARVVPGSIRRSAAIHCPTADESVVAYGRPRSPSGSVRRRGGRDHGPRPSLRGCGPGPVPPETCDECLLTSRPRGVVG
jgi:hypothetical protein